MPNISSKKTQLIKNLSCVFKISSRNRDTNFKANLLYLFVKRSFNTFRQCSPYTVYSGGQGHHASIDRETETLEREVACLHLYHSPAAE